MDEAYVVLILHGSRGVDWLASFDRSSFFQEKQEREKQHNWSRACIIICPTCKYNLALFRKLDFLSTFQNNLTSIFNFANWKRHFKKSWVLLSFHFEIVSLLKKVGSRLDVIMCTTQKKKVKEESKLKRELLFLFFSFEKLDVNHLTKTSCCQSNKKERKKSFIF